jgi:mRNA-degrading endonuclease toxin of MazEF toxin-antitoxin module
LAGFEPGQIVIADWRDALPKEPNKLRPAIVVEDPELFGSAYPSVILVPLTEDRQLAMPDLSLAIDPSPDNGCTKRCFAISHFVTATSKSRVTATASRILPEQLHAIRHQIALAVGLELSASASE